MRFSHLFLGFLAFIPLTSFSQNNSPENCTEYYQRQGAFSFHRQMFQDGTCFLSASPFVIPGNFKYRSFLATNQGLFMVFNSYSVEENSEAHGARVFHFFPRQKTPDVSSNTDQSSMSLPAPGIEIYLSQNHAKVLGMLGGHIQEDPKISRSNKGGIEFKNVETLYLDSGFSLGQDPTGFPKATSTFVDRKGRKCAVQNREVFTYHSDGEVDFKYSDGQLKAFLKTRCPDLTVNF